MTSSARPTARDETPKQTTAAMQRWGRRILNLILDIVFPPRCVGCGRIGSHFCQGCRELVRKPASSTQTYPLIVNSAGVFEGPLRSAIHALKYHKREPLAEILGTIMTTNGLDRKWEPDLIVPVPLHPSRQRERGFNQSELLASYAGTVLDIDVIPQALRRVRETRSQVGLGWKDRQDNVRDAFAAEPSLVQGKKILLIDDVVTTGATLGACAEALLKAGAIEVRALTLAAASGHDLPPLE